MGRLSPTDAATEALGYGYRSLDLYPGRTDEKWRCVHVECGSEVFVRLHVLRQGRSCCRPCGVKGISRARKMDPEKAHAGMVNSGLRPLTPFPGSDVPWKSECISCGLEVSPRYSNVMQGQGGCVACGRKKGSEKRTDEHKAITDMQEAGLRPLVAYPGVRTPWLCECIQCGENVLPNLDNVRNKGSRCQKCSSRGFDFESEAVVYALQHLSLGAVKVGIAGSSSPRLKKFEGCGWKVLKSRALPTGREAWRIEQKILRILRTELGLDYFLTPEDMGRNGGWTETFNMKLLTPEELVDLVEATH